MLIIKIFRKFNLNPSVDIAIGWHLKLKFFILKLFEYKYMSCWKEVFITYEVNRVYNIIYQISSTSYT
jgi:hypothetical protein